MRYPILLVIVATFLAAIAQFLYKKGAALLPVWFNTPLIIGVIVYCMTGLLIIIALKHVEMSVVFPLFATSFVWVAIISILFLNETLSIVNWAGIVAIVAGIGLLGRSA